MKNIEIVHALGSSEESGRGTGFFMLCKEGSYFLHNPESKYRGYHVKEESEEGWTMQKVIDLIAPGDEPVKTINRLSSVTVVYKEGEVTYMLGPRTLSLSSTLPKLDLYLDIREIYEFEDQGRIYKIENGKDFLVFEYIKYHNHMLETEKYRRYLAVRSEAGFIRKGDWVETSYPEDAKRKSSPSRLFIYHAGTFEGKGKIDFGYGKTKEEALEAAKGGSQEEVNESGDIALDAAARCLEDLYVHQGYYAGLPWFFQIWTRDQAISLEALRLVGQRERSKRLLLDMIKQLDGRGRIQNRLPHSDLGTADGTGWTFLRINELLKNEPGLFSDKDLETIKRKLKESIIGQQTIAEGLLIRNSPLETWMDTSYKGDEREGFCIEIQALFLAMLSLANQLGLGFEELEENTAKQVKEVFFDGTLLKDRSDDPVQRPNIFLAHYAYPQLLEGNEWAICFNHALECMWLDWGGLSTIDKKHPLFSERYTGEDNISYHRGDSWYFINNIAAICLHRLGIHKEKVEKIYSASREDLLYQGIIGKGSELSSASRQEAAASLHQLWTAATFIELHKVKNGQIP